MDGDGRAEILVGSVGVFDSAAYVVSGRADGNLVDLAAVAAGTGGGFKIIAEDFGDQLSSTALTAIPDLSGDGRAEILVGAPGNSAGGARAGAAYVVFGKADASPVDLDAIAAGSGGGFKIIGENANEQLSYWSSLTAISDLNGDGRAEILVGSRDHGIGNVHTDAGAGF